MHTAVSQDSLGVVAAVCGCVKCVFVCECARVCGVEWSGGSADVRGQSSAGHVPLHDAQVNSQKPALVSYLHGPFGFDHGGVFDSVRCVLFSTDDDANFS
jgi:hypothetical protein